MNGGLAFNAVLTLLLDDRFPVTGLMLLDDGRAVAIAVPVDVPMAFAHGYAGADRPGRTPTSSAIAGIASTLTAAATNRYFFMMSSFQLAPRATTVPRLRSDGTCANKRRDFAGERQDQDHGAVLRTDVDP